MLFVNRINKEELKQRLASETFKRKTISFYRYVNIADPLVFRNNIYRIWNKLECFGRIYIAHEGINAQMSVPEIYLTEFLSLLNEISELNNIPIKYAIEDDGKSFYKLTIKVRKKIVSDGLDAGSFDVTNVGNHLTAIEFHEAINDPDAIVVDMRNHYESEIGRFDNAYCPDADTFRDAIGMVSKAFKDDKNKKLLLYCTGGIRCEKASAYLKHQGFVNVNQLYGGIIEYAQQIKSGGLQSKFKGRNFVFDERLGESIDENVISKCHQCGNAADTHTNCANADCHLLFIQCSFCDTKYEGCCSEDCRQINKMPDDEKKKFRVLRHQLYSQSKIFKSRLRPEIMKQQNETANMPYHG